MLHSPLLTRCCAAGPSRRCGGMPAATLAAIGAAGIGAQLALKAHVRAADRSELHPGSHPRRDETWMSCGVEPPPLRRACCDFTNGCVPPGRAIQVQVVYAFGTGLWN
jgi:hypothetical protein